MNIPADIQAKVGALKAKALPGDTQLAHVSDFELGAMRAKFGGTVNAYTGLMQFAETSTQDAELKALMKKELGRNPTAAETTLFKTMDKETVGRYVSNAKQTKIKAKEILGRDATAQEQYDWGGNAKGVEKAIAGSAEAKKKGVDGTKYGLTEVDGNSLSGSDKAKYDIYKSKYGVSKIYQDDLDTMRLLPTEGYNQYLKGNVKLQGAGNTLTIQFNTTAANAVGFSELSKWSGEQNKGHTVLLPSSFKLGDYWNKGDKTYDIGGESYSAWNSAGTQTGLIGKVLGDKVAKAVSPVLPLVPVVGWTTLLPSVRTAATGYYGNKSAWKQAGEIGIKKNKATQMVDNIVLEAGADITSGVLTAFGQVPAAAAVQGAKTMTQGLNKIAQNSKATWSDMWKDSAVAVAKSMTGMAGVGIGTVASAGIDFAYYKDKGLSTHESLTKAGWGGLTKLSPVTVLAQAAIYNNSKNANLKFGWTSAVTQLGSGVVTGAINSWAKSSMPGADSFSFGKSFMRSTLGEFSKSAPGEGLFGARAWSLNTKAYDAAHKDRVNAYGDSKYPITGGLLPSASERAFNAPVSKSVARPASKILA